MESIQRNAEPSEDTIISPQQHKGEKTENEKLVEVQEPINPALDPGPTFKYSAEANDESYGSKRVKRAALPAIRNNKKTCHLYIQTDPLFWRHIYKQVYKVDIYCIFPFKFFGDFLYFQIILQIMYFRRKTKLRPKKKFYLLLPNM